MATATKIKTTDNVDLRYRCQRCGARLRSKGGRSTSDGLQLCFSCRGDKVYVAVASGRMTLEEAMAKYPPKEWKDEEAS